MRILWLWCHFQDAKVSLEQAKSHHVPEEMRAAMSLLIGSLWVVLWAIIIEGPPPTIRTETLLILILLGLLPTAMANFIRVVLIREAGPVFLGITNYIVPLWAALVGALVLKETLHFEFYFAAVITVTGIYISQMKSLAALFRSFRQ